MGGGIIKSQRVSFPWGGCLTTRPPRGSGKMGGEGVGGGTGFDPSVSPSLGVDAQGHLVEGVERG